MKKTIVSILTAGALVLTGCATGPSPETPSPGSSGTVVNGPITGVVGKQHGTDCADDGECSVYFTVDQLRLMDTCTDSITGDIVEGPFIDLHATVTTAESPVTPEFDSAMWTLLTGWSILDASGNDVPIQIESACLPDTGWRGTWEQETFPGDTRQTEQRYRIPTDAQTLRLTDSFNKSRWEFDLPEVPVAQVESTPNPTPPTPAPVFTPDPVPAPVPAPEPTTEAPAPVIGFTGAPGVDTPRILDKTIASCGDPMMYETGTTFFTDGTSGWTQECANQMGY
ncbi:hypothetical protein [Corynebacterium sp.]|uniref:hypothetical protein n=1 Tax=Corynebacterium sp. TaxID=1720 RepID=UPI00198584D9|nr:hypothetical protein [Corynebacterium sp.]HHU66662.1 hypothetical protein [Corynebacterium sp.]